MNRISQRGAISLSLALFVALSLGASLPVKKCSSEEKQTFKHNALAKVDTMANSIEFAQGVNEDLYRARKISPETAKRTTEVLKKANGLGRKLGQKINAIDPNATSLPLDLKSILDEIESVLNGLGVGQPDLFKAVADVISIVIELKGLF